MKLISLHITGVTLFFILLCTFVSSTLADDKVHIKLKQPPPGRLNVADFWSFTLTNLTNENQKVYLKGSATEEKDGLIATGQTVSINLNPNEVKNMKVSDLPQTPDINYVAKDGRYKESLIRQGKFPAGNYEICVSVISSSTNEELGSDCFSQEVMETGMVTLISPSDGEEIEPGTYPIFTWISTGSKTVELNIYEILDGQTPEIAVTKNRPFFSQKEIKSTTFTYPTSGKRFEEGKEYVWVINNGNIFNSAVLFVNNANEGRRYLCDFECSIVTWNNFWGQYGDRLFLKMLIENCKDSENDNEITHFYGAHYQLRYKKLPNGNTTILDLVNSSIPEQNGYSWYLNYYNFDTGEYLLDPDSEYEFVIFGKKHRHLSKWWNLGQCTTRIPITIETPPITPTPGDPPPHLSECNCGNFIGNFIIEKKTSPMGATTFKVLPCGADYPFPIPSGTNVIYYPYFQCSGGQYCSESLGTWTLTSGTGIVQSGTLGIRNSNYSSYPGQSLGGSFDKYLMPSSNYVLKLTASCNGVDQCPQTCEIRFSTQ